MSNGPNRMGLQNRKRIWKLVDSLVDLVYAIQDPGRILRGEAVLFSEPRCLATRNDVEGCRELTQVTSAFGSNFSKSRFSFVIPSYVRFSNRRLISGLSFMFGDGRTIDVGYVVSRQKDPIDYISVTCPKVLWLVSGPLGLEAISLDVYPQQYLQSFSSSQKAMIAVAKWMLKDLSSIYLGLDAIRIVRICMEVKRNETLNDILWTPPHPSFACPSLTQHIHEEDVAALRCLQNKSFSPASAIYAGPGNGNLVGIVVFSALGMCAGVTGIRFVYSTGVEYMWGSDDDAASLSFFLSKEGYLVKVTFTTNYITSGLFPQLLANPESPLDCISYEASSGGYIAGFCGSFSGPRKQLHCFGIVSTTTGISSKSAWLLPKTLSSQNQLQEIPLGGFKSHGQQRSRLLLNKVYHSAQASINPVMTRYRHAGQVTGILFRSRNDKNPPDLLGQWSGPGRTYDVEENEQIVSLGLNMTGPANKPKAPRAAANRRNNRGDKAKEY